MTPPIAAITEILDDEMDTILRMSMLALTTVLERPDPVPQHTSIRTGRIYTSELMQTESDPAFRDAARMGKPAFKELITLLKEKAGLRDSRKVSANEKLLILIHVLKGHTNRDTKALFQHSGSTITTVLHDIVDRFMSIQGHFFRQPLPNDAVPSCIGSNRKYYPWFKDCIGAEDGSHVAAIVNKALFDAFRDRKGHISQNVYAACDFRMLFTYVLAGWEGSAHDMRVKDDAVAKGMAILDGKFRLGDAGISLSANCLTPYRGVRYHLKEHARAQAKPADYKELFNLRHAVLRNVIERVFGVLKKRFPILNNMQAYTYQFQVKLVMVCFMLHNFIRTTETYEDRFWKEADHEMEREGVRNAAAADENDSDEEDEEVAEEEVAEGPGANASAAALKKWRDDMAKAMWEDYVLNR